MKLSKRLICSWFVVWFAQSFSWKRSSKKMTAKHAMQHKFAYLHSFVWIRVCCTVHFSVQSEIFLTWIVFDICTYTLLEVLQTLCCTVLRYRPCSQPEEACLGTAVHIGIGAAISETNWEFKGKTRSSWQCNYLTNPPVRCALLE